MRFYIYNYIGFNYIYKIYINHINNLIEKTLDKEQLIESLLNFKIKFNYGAFNNDHSNYMKETHMYKILSVLNKKIDEKSDIFRNFDKKYASYYPIEIITLYNFYMHN